MRDGMCADAVGLTRLSHSVQRPCLQRVFSREKCVRSAPGREAQERSRANCMYDRFAPHRRACSTTCIRVGGPPRPPARAHTTAADIASRNRTQGLHAAAHERKRGETQEKPEKSLGTPIFVTVPSSTLPFASERACSSRDSLPLAAVRVVVMGKHARFGPPGGLDKNDELLLR